MIRVADLLFSLIGLIVLSPIVLIFALLIVLDDFGSPLYIQERVGISGTTFKLLKLRSMKKRSGGLLISTSNDSRITSIGRFIRKYKIDELPQLLNVLMGSMSIVGPRPEVSKYVRLYSENQRKVLLVRPGITDYASITFKNENEILGNSQDPESTYINYILPRKLRLNMIWIRNKSLFTYFDCIFRTLFRILLR
jgi:lipopolysaccharide/colanic/teichoic acid biosynthesis glycosyltransferase